MKSSEGRRVASCSERPISRASSLALEASSWPPRPPSSAGCPPQSTISAAESGLFMAGNRPKGLILPLYFDAAAQLDDPICRQTEEVSGIGRHAGQHEEQLFLPARQDGTCRLHEAVAAD